MIGSRTQYARERGSALIAALFLVIVLAALGAFAVKLGTTQQQTANLQLLQNRALAAANAGLEYWAYRVANDAVKPTCAAPAPPVLNPIANPGFGDFTVTISCTRIASDAEWVYEVTAEAINSAAYGSPEFVRQEVSRRIKTW